MTSAPDLADDGTDRFYALNAERYSSATRSLDVEALRVRFLDGLRPGSLLLDAGSGSGRDTLAFLQAGHRVDAFDASPQLAELSTAFTGVPTRIERFETFAADTRYDGIWAAASLLHVPRASLLDAVARLRTALRPSGRLFASFKAGVGDQKAPDGRRFTLLEEPDLRRLVTSVGLNIIDLWRQPGVGFDRQSVEWVNLLARRPPSG